MNQTIPVEFNFELDKRKSESRREHLSTEIQNKRMSECTFKPKINEVPKDLHAKLNFDEPFYKRAMSWKVIYSNLFIQYCRKHKIILKN